ncbi:hypothetical protein EJ04DRAFT_576136 [Polyplosphaeria fusca]|uniref:DNA2/NAM7 helicase helicase domain-containing protein n=1 Tax=Polyplosphaeria fusca TaxID=682080 RepID=A0A9P4V4M4_9PLEO|nr:hypothetical protein EJ04DRAFT_576136 [Polyplosphaeria fusca]
MPPKWVRRELGDWALWAQRQSGRSNWTTELSGFSDSGRVGIDVHFSLRTTSLLLINGAAEQESKTRPIETAVRPSTHHLHRLSATLKPKSPALRLKQAQCRTQYPPHKAQCLSSKRNNMADDRDQHIADLSASFLQIDLGPDDVLWPLPPTTAAPVKHMEIWDNCEPPSYYEPATNLPHNIPDYNITDVARCTGQETTTKQGENGPMTTNEAVFRKWDNTTVTVGCVREAPSLEITAPHPSGTGVVILTIFANHLHRHVDAKRNPIKAANGKNKQDFGIKDLIGELDLKKRAIQRNLLRIMVQFHTDKYFPIAQEDSLEAFLPARELKLEGISIEEVHRIIDNFNRDEGSCTYLEQMIGHFVRHRTVYLYRDIGGDPNKLQNTDLPKDAAEFNIGSIDPAAWRIKSYRILKQRTNQKNQRMIEVMMDSSKGTIHAKFKKLDASDKKARYLVEIQSRGVKMDSRWDNKKPAVDSRVEIQLYLGLDKSHKFRGQVIDEDTTDADYMVLVEGPNLEDDKLPTDFTPIEMAPRLDATKEIKNLNRFRGLNLAALLFGAPNDGISRDQTGFLADTLTNKQLEDARFDISVARGGRKLNACQTKSVMNTLTTVSGVAITWGPPGTGKSYCTAAAIRQHLVLGRRVIVAAPSNRAVDEILNKVLEYLETCGDSDKYSPIRFMGEYTTTWENEG